MSDILSKCEDVTREIKDLESRIQKLQEAENYKIVKDSVRGSLGVFPYISKSIVIEGFEEQKESKKLIKYKKILEEKKDELLDIIIDIEEYLNQIDNSRIRQIIRYRYIDKKNWIQIGHLMKTSADGVRMELKRFLKKK